MNAIEEVDYLLDKYFKIQEEAKKITNLFDRIAFLNEKGVRDDSTIIQKELIKRRKEFGYDTIAEVKALRPHSVHTIKSVKYGKTYKHKMYIYFIHKLIEEHPYYKERKIYLNKVEELLSEYYL